MQFVDEVASKVAGLVVDTVWRQIGYVWEYNDNIQSLQDQVEKLKDEKTIVQHSIDEARRNHEEIEDKVKKWLASVDEAISTADVILRKNDAAKQMCFGGCRPGLLSRHRLSRRATKKALVVDGVRKEGKEIDKISYPTVLEAIGHVTDYETFPSRMLIFNQVVEALNDVDVSMTGVYGMGGIGKTTLIRRVAEQLKGDGTFKVVVMASVTQNIDISRIQQEIAELLRLKFDLKSTTAGADLLCSRINEEDKILIILDDIWAKIKLEDIGIPNDHKGCKILITSRSLNVLQEMGIKKNYFKIHFLEDEEARQLFEKTVGALKHPEMQTMAVEAAERCSGLPVLIVAVATALQDKELYEWKDALKRLKRPAEDDMEEQVQSCLELSYNFLKNDEIKKLFLLCGLNLYVSYPINDLLKYVVGLSLFKCQTLEEARNRLHTYLSQLKSSCLLLEGDRDGEVKMHDVVRNFAVSVASRDHNVFVSHYDKKPEWPLQDKLEQCSAIDVRHSEIPELPASFDCPQLRSFVLFSEDFSLKIPNDLFSKTKELRVLNLKLLNLELLPSSIQTLENLQTLCLESCILEDISLIGTLKKLQVLSFKRSYIDELPKELEQLARLKLLDLTNCYSLKVIPPNVLSKLKQLEDLRMENSFVQWEGEGQDAQQNNARLSELRNLPNLAALDIHVIDANILPKDLFSEKLERFKIFIGAGWDWSDVYGKSKVLKLKHCTRILLESVEALLKKTEDLHLDELKDVKNILDALNKEGFPHLKQMYVQNSPDIEYIVDRMRMKIFPALEILFLQNLKKLEEIHRGHYVMGSFSNLRTLKVSNCNGLRSLCSFSMFKGLVLLEEMDVSRCQILKKIVAVETREDSDTEEAIKLLTLRKLNLERLPQLACFFSQMDVPSVLHKPAATAFTCSKEIESEDNYATLSLLFGNKIQFPNLVDLKLASINVEKLWPNHLTGLSPLLTNLTTLIIDYCDNLSYLFMSSMVESLTLLKSIEISNCKSMKEVIVTEGEEMMSKIVFPVLQSLKLKSLESLTRFCVGNLIECSSLKVLLIENCPLLQTFISSSISTDVETSSRARQANSILFDAKVLIPNLESLCVINTPALKMLWCDELQTDSFCSLRELQVKHGKELVKIFPSKQLPRFKKLESLIVEDCNLIEEVFDLQVLMKIKEETDDVAATQLRYLEMVELPSLNKVWNGDPLGILSFHNLQDIRAVGCTLLKNLFPFSVAQSLPQLENISLIRCPMEEIVEKEEIIAANPKFEFPRLISLHLMKLGELKCFYPEKHILECAQLESLHIYFCDKLEAFTSEDLQTPPHLKEKQKSQVPQPLFSIEKVIPNLKQLSLDSKHTAMIRHSQFPTERLEFLELKRFHDDSRDSQFDFLQKFQNIKSLGLGDCDFKVLFTNDILVQGVRVFTQLEYLKLTELPCLSQIWGEDCQPGLVLPNLNVLSLWKCNSLITLAPSSASFRYLSTLYVRRCHGLLKLVESSTAKSLVNLTTLTVEECNMVTEIVANEEHASQSDSQSQIVLRNLERLKLCCLKNLTSFCSVAQCTIRFPSLKEVVVVQCPNMKIFSQDVVLSPSLKRVYMNEERDKWLWTGNLNDTIKQLYEDMVGFSGLQHLKLSEFPQVKRAWHNRLPVQLFRDLNILEIDDCGFTSSSVPTNLLPYLDNLKMLEVRNCDAVEQVFGPAWPNANGFAGHLSNLTILTVHGCDNLTHVLSSSMMRSVVNLKVIEICHCEKLEQVVFREAVEEPPIISETLISIKLENLPKLTQFCTSTSIKCPSLQMVEIENCPELMTFVSNSESSVNASSSELEILNSTLFDEKVLFPNLEKLHMKHVHKLKMIWNDELQEDSFCKLNYHMGQNY